MKDVEARLMLGVSLHRDSEKPLCDAVKVKPGLPWRPLDAGDDKVMGYLIMKAANREWNKPKRNKFIEINNTVWSWRYG